MAYLNGIGLKNFRIFKEAEYLEFRPITVLTGPNGSGKSSVIKALLLLQEAAKSKGNFRQLKFSSEKHQLGKFEYTTNDPQKPLEFFTKFSIDPKLISEDECWVVKMVFKKDHQNPDYGYCQQLIIYEEKSNTVLTKITLTGENVKYPLALSSFPDYTSDALATKASVNLKIYLDLIKWKQSKNNGVNEPSGKPMNDSLGNPILVDRGILSIKSYPIEMNNISIYTNISKRSIKLLANDKQILCYLKINSGESSNDNQLLQYTQYGDFEDTELNEIIDTIEKEAIERLSNHNDLYWEDEEFVKTLSHLDPFFRYFYNNMIHKDGKYSYKSKVAVAENYIPTLENEIIGFSGKELKILEYFYFEVMYVLYKKDLLNQIQPKYEYYRQAEPYDREKYINNTWKGIEKFFTEIITKSIGYLSSEVSSLNNLATIRSNASRVYYSHGDLSEFESSLKTFYELIPKLNKLERSFIETWIKKFGIADEIRIETPEGAGTFVRLVDNEGNQRNIADTGFGYSQLIAILLKIVIVANKSCSQLNEDVLVYSPGIIIIEEPESNLHPNLQSMIAEMLIDAADRFKILFIIETHSEYLIRKLQYLTAKKVIKPSDSVIYYFSLIENQKDKVVDRIDILKDGRLSKPFGPGFYDEATRLMLSIFEDENLN